MSKVHLPGAHQRAQVTRRDTHIGAADPGAQSDLICAPRLVTVKESSATHIGGYGRGLSSASVCALR
jgi:hypothetical protein